MKPLRIGLAITFAMWVSGCSTSDNESAADHLKKREHVTYYDRNGDGRVDLEKHEYRGVADANWERRDDNFDGRYEKKVLYGYAIVTSAVDIPVPSNVRISAKQ